MDCLSYMLVFAGVVELSVSCVVLVLSEDLGVRAPLRLLRLCLLKQTFSGSS